MKNRISELRKDRNITLNDLADRLGVHFTTVARHQSGSISVIPRETLAQYARIFDVEIMDLFLDPTEIPGGRIESGAE
jgi:transcriptional regulator with XRE-family HTH domain